MDKFLSLCLSCLGFWFCWFLLLVLQVVILREYFTYCGFRCCAGGLLGLFRLVGCYLCLMLLPVILWWICSVHSWFGVGTLLV